MSRLTSLHSIWRLFPARQRRHLLTRVATLLAPRIDTTPAPACQGIVVVGELSRPSGLGEGARLMLRALQHLGVAAWPIEIGGLLPGGSGDLPVPASPVPPDDAPLVVHVNPPLLPLVLLRLPRRLIRHRRVIGYWSWELPVVPTDWRTGTRFVHEVWAPSSFTASALESVLPGRVRVVPHPLALSLPTPSALDRAAFGLPTDAVIVLSAFNLASSFERKNPLGTIAAFRAAFGNRADRILVLKIGNPHHFPTDFARIVAAVGDAPNIRLETRSMPTADLHALMAVSDMVLSLHRSEGFGLVCAEAMSLGRPVVATGWSGNMDFMDDSSSALVGYSLISVRDPRHVYDVPGAVWAEPDVQDAVAQLRRLADDAEERTALGVRGRATVMAKLSAAKLADALRAIGLSVDLSRPHEGGAPAMAASRDSPRDTLESWDSDKVSPPRFIRSAAASPAPTPDRSPPR